MSQAIEKYDPSIAARIALTGNLAGLGDEQVWEYYQLMCRRLGLDPLSKPFDVMEQYEGKDDERKLRKTLYANVSCSTQLADKRRISYGEAKLTAEETLTAFGMKAVKVTVECSLPNGRKLTGESFVDLMAWGKPLAGQKLENALKKAATQARRRGTLQLCGVALPDESEIQDIPNATPLTYQPPVEAQASPLLEAAAAPRQIEAGKQSQEFDRQATIEACYAGITKLQEAYGLDGNEIKERIATVAGGEYGELETMEDETLEKVLKSLRAWFSEKKEKAA